MVFESPGYLFLLLLLPLAVYFRHFWRGRGGKLPFAFRMWNARGFSPGYLGRRLLFALAVLAFWSGLVALILALAGAARVSRDRVYLDRGIDIMVVLDESPSMAAQDFAPENRFESARETIRRFVERRENDPIGVVSFGREAALRMPPTTDYGKVIETIDELRIMELGDGTAIGMGIALGALHLQSSEASERVMILLTDGKNNAGEVLPETAARIATEIGVRIYTIGIGSDRQAEIEFTDPETEQVYRGTLEEGFDEDLLREIAEVSGGAYFYAGTSGTLDSVFEAIDTIETTEQRMRLEVHTDPQHRLLIVFALAALLFDFLVRKLLLREVL
ncbi:MAG: VWA domain-containing protein [Spirochaetaceae bacterium]